MKIYDPKNWYWFVAGDKTKVFSSASGDYVQASDPTFVAWASDTTPTSIDSEANLGAVLAPTLQRPVNANILDAYQGNQADTVVLNLTFKIIFNHENRIRVLEGKAPLTVPQARAAIKALM